MPDGLVHHITAPGHDETHIRSSFQYLGRSFDKILRTLLEGDTSKEGDDFVFHSPFDPDVVPAAEIHRIVDRNDLCRINTVFIDYDIAGQVAHRNYGICCFHSLLLYGIYARIHHIIGATVK